jgi:hypothetical protein
MTEEEAELTRRAKASAAPLGTIGTNCLQDLGFALRDVGWAR